MTAYAVGTAALLLGAVSLEGCGKESEVEQSGGPEPTSSETDDVSPPEEETARAPTVELSSCALRGTEGGSATGPAPGAEKEAGGGREDAVGLDEIGSSKQGWGAGAPASGYRPRRPSDARVKIQTPTTSGVLPDVVVRRILRQHTPRLRYCYEKALINHPGLEGKVVANFVVDPKGNVSSVALDGVNPDLDACVATSLRAMRFPAPESGGIEKVRAPLAFTTGGKAPGGKEAAPKSKLEAEKQPVPIADAQPPMPDMAAMVVTLRSELQPVRDCYQRALETDAQLTGALHLDLSIAPDGAISEARPSAAPPSLEGGELAACTIEAVRAMRLREWQAGSRQVTCTFVFSLGAPEQ